jgi:acyl-CoA reductase-like NAD-dependent aldehyde dehydrogenase
MKEYRFLLAGKWLSSQNSYEVKNPFDDSIVGKVYRADEKDIDEVASKAVKGFEITRRLPSYRRAEILQRVADGIKERSEEIALTLCLESGKPIRDARTEVSRAINTFSIAVEEAKRIGGELLPLDLAEASKNRLGITKRFPLGPILGILPFNFPLNLVAHKVAPAIAAGNSIVVKPSSSTPITCLLLGEVILEAGFPPEAISVLPCRPTIAEKLVAHDSFKLVTFTGSADIGWNLKKIAGKKRVTLELGGNAGLIINSDADLDYAIPRAVVGSFSYAGQICISIQRIYVHQDIYKEFIDRFLNAVAKLKVGDPREENTDVGPVIDDSAAERIKEWLEEAKGAGAKFLCGGERKGRLIQPTVLAEVDPSLKVSCQEVFAPVVTLTPYADFIDAVKMVDDSTFGLQAGVFTKDINNIFKAFNGIEVGGLIVNDIPTYRIDHMPYGGVKDSGLGREGVKYAIEEMTELKLMVLNLPEK